MSPDDALEGAPPPEPGAGLSQYPPLDLPLDFEGYYLGHQEVFHAYAEVQFGSREVAEEVIHEVFLQIHASWGDLLAADNLDQGAWGIVRRVVHERLDLEGRPPRSSSTAPSPRLSTRPWPPPATS